MKYLLISFLLIMSTCNKKNAGNLIQKSSNENLDVKDCPENGTCTVEVLKNKTFTVEKDGIGMIYPKIIDGNKTVLIYTFKKENAENYADGNESETLHIELDDTTSSTLKDGDLQQVKMLFGKHCFCRGLAGYYKVEKGTFNIERSKKEHVISIDFNVPKVGDRQFVKSIKMKVN